MPNAVVHIALKLSPERERQILDQLLSHGLEARVVSAVELERQLPHIERLLIGRPPRIDWGPAVNLRLLHVAGAGVDPLFPAHGLRPEVVITSSRGAHAELIRDHVIALLLALYRDLPRAFAQQVRREWRSYPTQSLAGQRLCIVGLGEIGSRVAPVANALGMRVTGVCRTPRDVPGVEHVARPEQLSELAQQADAIAICVPLTSHTRGLFDAALIERLPQGMRLINVSRGAVLDEFALERALRAGRLTAALDVFDTEPLPAQSTLWDCPGLIVSPHVAGFAADYLDGVIELFLDALNALEQGQTPRTVVTREREY